MTVDASKMIKRFIDSSLRNLPMKVFIIQQLLTNSLLSKTQFASLMAQPYEIIYITSSDNQVDTKLDQ